MNDSNNRNVVVKGGVGFVGLLGIVFIVLKLCKVINWPWIWVLAPFWIYAILYIIFLITVVIIAIVVNRRDSW